MTSSISNSYRHFWFYCKLGGMLAPQHFKPLYYLYSLIINFPCFILITCSYIFYFMYELRDLAELLRVFQDFLLIVTVNVQTVAFYLGLKDLQRVDITLDGLTSYPSFSKKDEIRIKNMISVSKKMFIVYVLCNHVYLLVYAITALAQREKTLLFPLWFPFDWKASNSAYWCAFLYQIFISLDFANRSIPIFFYPVQYLLAICEHFDILALRMQDVGWTTSDDSDGNYQQLVECIKVHQEILRIFDDLATIMPRTILWQFMMTGFDLCSSLVPIIIGVGLPPFFVVRIIFLIPVIILPIVPCCYYGDKFMQATDSFTTTIYSCNWPDQTLRFQKTLLVFMMMSRKKKSVFLLKMIPVNLPTLMKILKFTYTLITFIMQFG